MVIFLTGLSGSGKTTIAHSLVEKYREIGVEPKLLDGDEIRKSNLITGFDEESRKQHNINVGKMASSYEEQGHVVIIALIAPYIESRNEVRKMCKEMLEVYLNTDIKVCIQRDPKGLYAKAMTGEIDNFTGISAPYFPPVDPEVTIDTAVMSISECSEIIFKKANH